MTAYHKNKAIEWSHIFDLKNMLLMLAGVCCAVFAMKGFMIPNSFMDGGITGISLLIHEVFHINISLLIIVFNIPFIILSYRKISKTFAVFTIFAELLLATGLVFIELPPITNDKLLIAVFGGALIGAGIGLVIRAGAILDGAEVVVVFTKRRTGFSTREIIMVFNFLIFAGAAFHLGIETAMYSLITFFTATWATEYVVDGIEEHTAMNIISSNHEEVKRLLVNDLGKGITVFKGERGYLPGQYDIKVECEIIVTIISRLEIKVIQEALEKIDPHVFVYIQSVKEATGGILKAKAHVK